MHQVLSGVHSVSVLLHISTLQVRVEVLPSLQGCPEHRSLCVCLCVLLSPVKEFCLWSGEGLQQVRERGTGPSLWVPADGPGEDVEEAHVSMHSWLQERMMTNQQPTISSCTALGQPGGGGSLQPPLTILTVYKQK